MEKKMILCLILISIAVITLFLSFRIFFSLNSSPVNNKDDDVIILYDKSYPGYQYIYKEVYKYEDGSLCINTCEPSKNKKLYAIIKTENPFPTILEGSNDNIALLIKDGDSLKLVDLKKRTMEKFIFHDLFDYKVIIEKETLVGLIINSLTENYFYSNASKTNLYMNKYDNLSYIDGYLIACKDKSLYILNQKEENIFIQIDDVGYKIDKIKDIKYINDKVHIRSLTEEGYNSYYIYDKNGQKICEILGDYEEIILENNKLYAINNKRVNIYDLNGALTKTTYFNNDKIIRVILNYVITLNNNTLNSINMDNGDRVVLFQNMNNLAIYNFEFKEKTKEIFLIFSEYDYEDIPKKYEITYDIDKKEVRVLES